MTPTFAPHAGPTLSLQESSSSAAVDVYRVDEAMLAQYEDQLRGRALVLYDGVCGFCNRVVHFLMPRDRADRLRYAPLESGLARAMLARHPSLGQTAETMQSVVLVLDALTPLESVQQRSDAVLAGMRLLPSPWPLLAAVLRIVPRLVRDVGYRIVARLRYRIFGRYAACPIPSPTERKRILGVAAE